MAEQPVMRGLAGGQEGHDLAARLFESLGERLDGLRHQRGDALGAQRQPNVGGGQHFSRQLAQCLAELRAERHTAHLRHHRQQRPGHALGFLGQRRGPHRRNLFGHRVAQPLPRVQRVVDPVGGGPRHRFGGARPAARSPRPATSRPGARRRRSPRRSSPGRARRNRSSSTPAAGPGRSSPGPDCLPPAMAPPAPLNISPSLEKICPSSDMSKPDPNGSDPESPGPDPESGSFLRLSRSGSSPEKPNGRSAMSSTVLIGGPPCGSAGHALSEPAARRPLLWAA